MDNLKPNARITFDQRLPIKVQKKMTDQNLSYDYFKAFMQINNRWLDKFFNGEFKVVRQALYSRIMLFLYYDHPCKETETQLLLIGQKKHGSTAENKANFLLNNEKKREGMVKNTPHLNRWLPRIWVEENGAWRKNSNSKKNNTPSNELDYDKF